MKIYICVMPARRTSLAHAAIKKYAGALAYLKGVMLI